MNVLKNNKKRKKKEKKGVQLFYALETMVTKPCCNNYNSKPCF